MFFFFFFFFKQKTAYEMRISDWSSDVCSSDLHQWIALEREVEASRAVGSSDGATPVIPVTLFDERRTKQTVHVGVRVVSTTQPTVQQMCEKGLGIARLSYIEVLSSLKHHDLVHVLPKWTFPTLPVTLVTPRKDGQPAKVRAAVDALRSYFRGLPVIRSSTD